MRGLMLSKFEYTYKNIHKHIIYGSKSINSWYKVVDMIF